MDFIVAMITAFITVGILGYANIDKTATQFMLLGIEFTIIGAVLILLEILFNSNSNLFLVGVSLIVAGLIINLFGFGKD